MDLVSEFPNLVPASNKTVEIRAGRLIFHEPKPLVELGVFVKEILCPTGFDDRDPWNGWKPRRREKVSYVIWDVRNVEAIFPPSLIPAVLRRRQERERLQEEAQELFSELPLEERVWIASQNVSRKRRKLETAAPVLLDEKSKDVVIEAKSLAIKSPISKKERSEKLVVKPAPEPKVTKPIASITGFFSPVKKANLAPRSSDEPVHISDYMKYFHPFRVKHNTTIAKPVPLKTQMTPGLDTVLSLGCSGDVDARGLLCQAQQFLASQKGQLALNMRSDVRLDESDDESLIFTSGLRPKLLHFHENYRPAFFGAWVKESAIINPRNFLKKDPTLLDYSLDSEEEWVDEEEGELLDDSDEEDEEDEEDLSKDGSDKDEELGKEASDDEEPSLAKPTSKLRKNTVLKPILFGVSYDKSQVASFIVGAARPLISLSYQLSQADCKFPIDPFGPVPDLLPQPSTPAIE
ncbi:Chromatin assembly factor 1, subunit A [Massospora cicadina]|nr:Chromatin assembly factor 1, subunit A [Massospora cicadina]